MRILRLLLSTALGLATAATLAAPVFAAPAATSAPQSASASTPVDAAAGGPIDLQIWPGQAGETAIITVVEVDAATKLPVTVRVPVVPGSTVEWVGEILGGTAEADVEVPYKLVQGQGGQFAEFTLTKSRRGQVDAIGFPLETSGDKVLLAVEYVQTVSSPLTTVSVRVPANVTKVKISPKPSGDPFDNADGESLYTLEPVALKPGEKQKISLSYSTIPPVEPTPGSEANLVLIGLGIALVIAVIAMIVVINRRSTASAASQDALDEGSETEIAEGTREGDDVSLDDDEPDLDFK
jgi:hypothetical protein